MDLQKEIDSLKVKAGYDGKPQQWQFGFDLACRELAKAQAIPAGYVLVPKEPTSKILQAMKKANDNGIHATQIYRCGLQYKAMIEAQEPTND